VTEHSAPEHIQVLLFGWDGGGNVPPLVALGKHLVARGHEVRMVGAETMAERAGAAGIDFTPFVRTSSWTARPGHALEDEMDDFATHLLGPELGEELLGAVDASRPDVLVVDCMAGGALSVAEYLALPTAVLVHLRARFHYDSAGGSSVASQAAKEALNRQRSRIGLPPLALEQSLWAQLWDRAGRVFIASLPELEGPGHPLPAGFTYVGSVSDPDPEELPAEVAALVSQGGPPLVVTSLSTTYMHQEAQLATAAAALQGLRGVVTLGSGIAADELGGGDQLVVTRWASHERLLPHADVVVTHAGHGTVLAALAAGVPLVCMPMGRDQHGNGEQVTRLGVGVCIEPSADSARVRAAIDEVLEDSAYRANAKKLAASARQFGGGSVLADHIQSLVGTAPTHRSVPTT
jgi:UDP:flavonoid glycosyltransferase YjiC (YdhE family)